jgi:tetratricopeptide (TPR) repeat protein
MTQSESSDKAAVRIATSLLFVASCLHAATVPPETDYDRAHKLYSRTDYNAAITILERTPQDARVLKLLGQCYYGAGDFKKSTEALEKAATIAPNDSMIQTWLGRAWGMRAESAFPLAAVGHAGKTRDAFERAVKLDPKNHEALGDLFDFYMGAPGVVGGGLDKAEALLPNYAQYDPLGFHIAKAHIAEKKQKYPEAEASFRKAVETSPQTLSVNLELAEFLSRRERFDESEAVFQHAAEMSSDSPRVWYAKANTYIKARRNVTQARDLLTRYLASTNLTPNDPQKWEAQKLLKKVEGN